LSEEGLLRRSGDLDVVACKVLRQIRVNAHGCELALSVGERQLEHAVDVRLGNDELLYLVRLQIALDIAVGYKFDLPRPRPQALQDRDPHEDCDEVPAIEIPFLFHGLPACSPPLVGTARLEALDQSSLLHITRHSANGAPATAPLNSYCRCASTDGVVSG
jgi:hypothetical protein